MINSGDDWNRQNGLPSQARRNALGSRMVNYHPLANSHERRERFEIVPERKIGSQTRSFDCVKIIKEVGSILLRMERCGKKTTVTSILVPTLVVQ